MELLSKKTYIQKSLVDCLYDQYIDGSTTRGISIIDEAWIENMQPGLPRLSACQSYAVFRVPFMPSHVTLIGGLEGCWYTVR